MSSVPQHVAIIMDGNGRWAKAKGKPRSYGHYCGTDNVRNIAIAANNLGVKVLTLYAFSTENWKRPQQEVDYLMSLPAIFIDKFLKELMEKDPRLAIEKAVKGMLQHNTLGAEQFNKLKVYAGAEHPHAAQKPIVLEKEAK